MNDHETSGIGEGCECQACRFPAPRIAPGRLALLLDRFMMVTVSSERRSSGLLRVPFVRRCRLEFSARTLVGFTVNLNVLGAYVAAENGDFPQLGETVICHLTTPENEFEMPVDGMIAWVNAHQAHLVHSLPPGFGIKFERLADGHRRRIQDVVDEYLKRHPHGR